MNRREFFKVCSLAVAGALGIVKLPELLPKPLLADDESDLSRSDKWWAGDWDGGLYTVPWPWWIPSLPSGEFQGLHKLINTGHAEGGHKIAE